jgi:hypothetical protein
MSDTASSSVGLADAMLGSHSHICAFFQSAEEARLRVTNAELSPRDQAAPELYQ